MRLFTSLLQAGILLSAVSTTLAASWTFTDATIAVSNKGSGASPPKEKLSPSTPLKSPIQFSPETSLKIILTTTTGTQPSKPHQAHLLLSNPSSNLDISYPFSVKESGRSTLTLSWKDLPLQFQSSSLSSGINANIVLGSFGSTTGYNSKVFTLSPVSSEGGSVAVGEKPLRYGKQPEIHHIFKADPKSPSAFISVIFAAATATTVPLLLVAWLSLSCNLNHLSHAFKTSPISHSLFLGSIISLEGVLFLYYTTWNLFQTLPVLGVLGVVALVSGSRALTEVQERRLGGLR